MANSLCKTKEGFSFKNLKHFPSSEWGEDGGASADLYLTIDKQNVKIGHVFNAGDGGCANFDWDKGIQDNQKSGIMQKALDFLKRCHPSYSQDKGFNWLKNRTIDKFDDDDWDSVLVQLETFNDHVKIFKKMKDRGYQFIGVVDNGIECNYYGCHSNQLQQLKDKFGSNPNTIINCFSTDTVEF